MTVSSSRRYLSVWLRRLSTDRIGRRSAAPHDAPGVVTETVRSAQRIAALDDAAAKLGLRIGMPLADARAMYPHLAVTPADAEADRRLLEAVADWCDRYTPLVGLDPPDGLALDISGCAHLFGGEAALARDLAMRLARQGLRARVGVADTFGCAWATARHGAGGIVAPGGAAAALAPLPLAALRIEPRTVADLKTAGLFSVADVAARPRAPLAARFGAGLVRSLDRALGREDEPIVPRLPVPDAVAEQPFPEPIAREEDVLATVENLARRLDGILERRGEGARLIRLALFRTDGKVHRLEIGTGAPLRDPLRIRRLFQDRLAVLGDACDPGFGFDLVRLAAPVSERADPVQTGLAATDHGEELAHLIDRLGARFGADRLSRPVAQDTHVPEYAVAAVPAHALSRRAGRSAVARPGLADGDGQDSLSAIRPLRLFERPESIEATAEVPDGPPVQFRWRKVLHEVARAEGPERIAMEWWRDDRGSPLTRDYFRVESRRGVRAWLYRQGIYGRESLPLERPRWFLHGLFA